ncbi:MAG: zf-HC2 domain-containing protein [Deltaproteobacteria bacterium]|nr:zf-HC2 domain-containing protein [Deltaproteobacteria bacterium]
METGSCGWVRRFLGPWKDGELDPADAARIEAHLASCPACAAQARFEKWFGGEVRRLADRPRAPERLAQRVSFELRRAQRARRVRRAAWAAGSVAAAAGLVLLVAFVARGPSPGSGPTADRSVVAQPSGAGGAPPSASPAPPGFQLAARHDGDPFAAELVDRHERVVQRTLPLELATADGGAAAAWFQGKVPFALRVPRFADARIRLRGGRLTHVGDRDAAYLGYELQGHSLSVLVVPGDARPVGGERAYDVGGRTVFASSRGEIHYAVFRDGEVVYALVSDLPETTLVELAGQIR